MTNLQKNKIKSFPTLDKQKCLGKGKTSVRPTTWFAVDRRPWCFIAIRPVRVMLHTQQVHCYLQHLE